MSKPLQTRDVRLDMIRLIATVLVFVCHYFQVVGSLFLHHVFDIGVVQIFFLLSAFLSCRKIYETRNEIKRFYLGRVKRLMVPVWLYLLEIVLLLLIARQTIAWDGVAFYSLGLAAFSPHGVLGLGHFWYITIALITYLITPLLSYLCNKVNHRCVLYAYITVGGAATIAVLYPFALAWCGVNLYVYAFGFVFFHKHRADPNWDKQGMKYTLIPAVVLKVGRLVLDSVLSETAWYFVFYDSVLVTLIKAVEAFAVICLLHYLFGKIPAKRLSAKPAMFLLGLSYEIYLTHQFLLLSFQTFLPGALKGTVIGYVLVFVSSAICTVCNSWVLHWLTDKCFSVEALLFSQRQKKEVLP